MSNLKIALAVVLITSQEGTNISVIEVLNLEDKKKGNMTINLNHLRATEVNLFS